jgi:hypothetical protein
MTQLREQRSTPVWFNGKIVMTVCNGVGVRKARAGEMLLKPRAWSFHLSVLQQLEAAGARQLIVEDQETGITYTVDWPVFLAKSFCLNRGAGPQRALPIGYWHVVHGPTASPQLGGQRTPTPPRQLALFEV